MLELPDVVLNKVLSFLTFEEAARLRIVSRGFNRICSDHLNRGFFKVRKTCGEVNDNVERELPKRTPERQNHPKQRLFMCAQTLASNICIMDFSVVRYIRAKKICFFAGKCLDEVERVLPAVQLKLAEKSPSVIDTVFLLPVKGAWELAIMAAEHFKFVLLPDLEVLESDEGNEVTKRFGSSPAMDGTNKTEGTCLNCLEKNFKLEASLKATKKENTDLSAKVKTLEDLLIEKDNMLLAHLNDCNKKHQESSSTRLPAGIEPTDQAINSAVQAFTCFTVMLLLLMMTVTSVFLIVNRTYY